MDDRLFTSSWSLASLRRSPSQAVPSTDARPAYHCVAPSSFPSQSLRSGSTKAIIILRHSPDLTPNACRRFGILIRSKKQNAATTPHRSPTSKHQTPYICPPPLQAHASVCPIHDVQKTPLPGRLPSFGPGDPYPDSRLFILWLVPLKVPRQRQITQPAPGCPPNFPPKELHHPSVLGSSPCIPRRGRSPAKAGHREKKSYPKKKKRHTRARQLAATPPPSLQQRKIRPGYLHLPVRHPPWPTPKPRTWRRLPRAPPPRHQPRSSSP